MERASKKKSPKVDMAKEETVAVPDLFDVEIVKRQVEIVGMLGDWNKRSDNRTWHLAKYLPRD